MIDTSASPMYNDDVDTYGVWLAPSLKICTTGHQVGRKEMTMQSQYLRLRMCFGFLSVVPRCRFVVRGKGIRQHCIDSHKHVVCPSNYSQVTSITNRSNEDEDVFANALTIAIPVQRSEFLIPCGHIDLAHDSLMTNGFLLCQLIPRSCL